LSTAPLDISNLLQGLAITKFGQAWVVDFTYLWFAARFIYLALVEDLFTRQIVGFACQAGYCRLAGCLGQIIRAGHCPQRPGQRIPQQGTHGAFGNSGIKPSMSEKASPWQNGYKESFYSEFKLELGDPNAYQSLGELTEAISHQIHCYNYRRIHTALKCPPAVFAQRATQTKNAFDALKIITNSTENKKRILV